MPANPHGQKQINQGDIYWIASDDLEQSVRHPYVVVQDDMFNHSRIDTVVVCALTSNMNKVSMQGNVLLEAGEGNLERASVVEVAKITSVSKSDLGDYIGTISQQRIEQIFAGIRFVQTSFLR